MNRNPDGSELTSDQLRQIARDNGVSEHALSGIMALHNTGLIHSALLDLTMGARLTMFLHGELTLNTRNRFNDA